MRRPRNGFCPQAAHRPPTLPPRELASAARAVFISITTAEAYGLGGARQRCFQESARRKSIGTRAVVRMALMPIIERSAAEAAAGLAAERQRNGRTVDMRDTQIAGIVIARRATLATRNVKHFADLTAQVVNPWEAKR